MYKFPLRLLPSAIFYLWQMDTRRILPNFHFVSKAVYQLHKSSKLFNLAKVTEKNKTLKEPTKIYYQQ